jgi:hypothetical protein
MLYRRHGYFTSTEETTLGTKLNVIHKTGKEEQTELAYSSFL